MKQTRSQAKRAKRKALLAEVRATLQKANVQPEQPTREPEPRETEVREQVVRGLTEEAPDGGVEKAELPNPKDSKITPAKRTRSTAKRKSTKRGSTK